MYAIKCLVNHKMTGDVTAGYIVPDAERLRVRQALGEFIHIVVSEKQKRGVMHFHVAVVGFQDVDLIRRIWRSVVGEGNIDVKYRVSKKGIQWKRNRLASYLSKYISKSFDLDSFIGRHRYQQAGSRNIWAVTSGTRYQRQ